MQIVFQNILESGFILSEGYAWPFDKPDNLVTEPSAIEKQLTELQSGEELIFWQYPFEFEIRINNMADQRAQWIISVDVDTLMGPYNKNAKANTESFISVVSICLNKIETLYGCAPILHDLPKEVDVYGLRVFDVFPITYYGSKYVKLLGRENLASVPAYIIEEINRGFLIVASLEAIYADDPESLVRVRDHLASNAQGFNHM
jgi:hypothetical protein